MKFSRSLCIDNILGSMLPRICAVRWSLWLLLPLLVACGRASDDGNSGADPVSGPDGTAPFLTSVTLANAQDASHEVALGETALLIFEASEGLTLPTVTIGGRSALVEGSERSWQASIVMTEDDDEGTVTFSITFADLSGEEGASVSALTDDKNLRYCQNGCSLACEAPLRTIYDFENPASVFTFVDFAPDSSAGRTAAPSMLTVDPVSGGNTVVVSQKDAASLAWGGSLVIEGSPTQANKIVPLSATDALVTLRFWSPQAGKTIKLKLEDLDDDTNFVEATAVATKAQQWETLAFDMSNPSAGEISASASYAKIVVFYDADNAGTGSVQTFYWDDVTHGGLGADACAPQIQFKLDFEDVTASYTFGEYPSAAVATGLVVDPQDPDNRVLYSEKGADADPRAGSWVIAGTEVLPDLTVSLTADDSVVAMKFSSPAANKRVTLALEVVDDGTVFVEATERTQKIGEWETLYFDFSEPSGGVIDPLASYGKFVVRYDEGTRGGTQSVGFYWDDLTYGGQVLPADPDQPVVVRPATAAPIPLLAPENVLAIFSDSYSILEGTNFDPDWDQTTAVAIEAIDSNDMLKYTALNYQGTEFAAPLDVSDYESIHLDFWTNDATDLSFSLVSTGPQELPYALPVVTNEWVSVDIPLSVFASAVDLVDVIQFKVQGNGTVFFDNWYFASSAPVVAATTLSELQTSVFTPLCSGCHGGGAPSQGLSLEAGLTYEYTVGVSSSEVPSLNIIEAGDAQNSYLYQKVIGTNSVGGQMPLGGPYLSETVTDQIKSWIEAGALNN